MAFARSHVQSLISPVQEIEVDSDIKNITCETPESRWNSELIDQWSDLAEVCLVCMYLGRKSTCLIEMHLFFFSFRPNSSDVSEAETARFASNYTLSNL